MNPMNIRENKLRNKRINLKQNITKGGNIYLYCLKNFDMNTLQHNLRNEKTKYKIKVSILKITFALLYLR